MPFTRQTPQTISIYQSEGMLNKEQVLQVEFSRRAPREAVSKQQGAAFTCSSALLFPLHPASSIPSWRAVTLWHCSQDLALMLPTPECFVLSQDCRQRQHNRARSYREGTRWHFHHSNSHYSKWHWNNSYTPSPHSHHQTKVTSDRDFWQRMKSRNF